MKTQFVKMHGVGNDFIMLDGIRDTLPQNLSAFARDICHRRFGVGADQVLIAYPSQKADFRMAIYNADGGLVEMCGNGIRCFAKFLRDLGHTEKTELVVETLAGPIKPKIRMDLSTSDASLLWVAVDMGKPILAAPEIPVCRTGTVVNQKYRPTLASALLKDLPQDFAITAVSMGNPHCVIFVDDVQKYPVAKIGPVIENDEFFPSRVNVEFVQVKDRQHLIQRTWERGSGETYACGTGACAVCVAAVLNDKAERAVTITLKGGDLQIFWDEKSGHVFKTGPAQTVFSGVWEI